MGRLFTQQMNDRPARLPKSHTPHSSLNAPLRFVYTLRGYTPGHSPDGSLSPVTNCDFPDNGFELHLDSVLAHIQLARDRFVGISIQKAEQYLLFPFMQIGGKLLKRLFLPKLDFT